MESRTGKQVHWALATNLPESAEREHPPPHTSYAKLVYYYKYAAKDNRSLRVCESQNLPNPQGSGNLPRADVHDPLTLQLRGSRNSILGFIPSPCDSLG